MVKNHENCPELGAVLDEYHKPVVIQDQVLGELTLNKDYDTFEGEIQWCGKDVSLSLEVNAESKPSWTRARSAAKKLLADCETWDKACLLYTSLYTDMVNGVVQLWGIHPSRDCPAAHGYLHRPEDQRAGVV